MSQRAVNSVPEGIVHAVIAEWIRVSPQRYFLFVDAFAGFASVSAGVESYGADVELVSNDLFRESRGSVDFDCSKSHTLEDLMLLGFGRMRARIPTLHLNEVAVLFWCSTPCQSYGPQGRGYHRPNGGKLTQTARLHDDMNNGMAKYLYLTRE